MSGHPSVIAGLVPQTILPEGSKVAKAPSCKSNQTHIFSEIEDHFWRGSRFQFSPNFSPLWPGPSLIKVVEQERVFKTFRWSNGKTMMTAIKTCSPTTFKIIWWFITHHKKNNGYVRCQARQQQFLDCSHHPHHHLFINPSWRHWPSSSSSSTPLGGNPHGVNVGW